LAQNILRQLYSTLLYFPQSKRIIKDFESTELGRLAYMVEGQIENYSLAASNGKRVINIKALLRNKTLLYYYYYY